MSIERGVASHGPRVWSQRRFVRVYLRPSVANMAFGRGQRLKGKQENYLRSSAKSADQRSLVVFPVASRVLESVTPRGESLFWLRLRRVA